MIDETFHRRPGDIIAELRDTDSRFLCALMTSSPELQLALSDPDTYARVMLELDTTGFILTLVDMRDRAVRLEYEDRERRATVSLGAMDEKTNEMTMLPTIPHELTGLQSERLIHDIESVATMILQKRTTDEVHGARRDALQRSASSESRPALEPKQPSANRIRRALSRLGMRT